MINNLLHNKHNNNNSNNDNNNTIEIFSLLRLMHSHYIIFLNQVLMNKISLISSTATPS